MRGLFLREKSRVPTAFPIWSTKAKYQPVCTRTTFAGFVIALIRTIWSRLLSPKTISEGLLEIELAMENIPES